MTQRKSPSAAKVLQVRNGQDGITPDMTRSELAASVVCKSPLLVASALQKYTGFGNEMQLTDSGRNLPEHDRCLFLSKLTVDRAAGRLDPYAGIWSGDDDRASPRRGVQVWMTE